MRSKPYVVWGVVLGLVGATGCAGGEDRDGATSFARPGGGDGDGLDEGDTDEDGEDDGATGGADEDEPAAGGVSDTSDPSTDSPSDDPAAGDEGGAPAPPPAEPPPNQPPQQPPQAAPCEGMCAAFDACGVEAFASCTAVECVSEDGGGPCDQALAALAVCVASLPDCNAVHAYLTEPGGVYPCMDHDANVAFACGF